MPRDLRERLARGRAPARARRAALPPLSRRARLLVRAAGGQGADRPGARARGRARVDERRRRGRHPHDERGGGARRRRRPHRPPRAAARHGRRRGRGRRGDDRRRSHAARAGAQGRDLRHRRVHARPRAARELPLPAGLRRLCGDHERGRLRPHRVVGRRAAAQHEPRVDVPGPAREGDRAAPGHGRHVLGRGRLDDLRRQARPARRQREAPLQRALPGVLPLGPAHRRVPEPRPDPGLGSAQPGPLRQRRVRPADRARRASTTPTSSAARRSRTCRRRSPTGSRATAGAPAA